jgi:membrane-associated phospholipid phosphatase
MIARPPLVVPLLALAGFLALLGLVTGGWPPLHHLDTVVSHAFRGYGSAHPGLVAVLRVVTDVAATVPFLVTGLVATVVLLVRAQWPAAVLCAVLTVAVPISWALLHWLVYRPRPQDGFVAVASNGFPSGHTTNSAALALGVVLVLWRRVARTGRVVTAALAALFAIFIGVTRVALLAHWPSDVFGGWLLALTVVPLAARLADRSVPRAGVGRAALEESQRS